jgi:hypothetical protein
MSSLRVWIDSAGASQDGMTQFILIDEETDDEKLEEEISNSSLPSRGWLTLSFPVDWQSGGKWHTLTVKNAQPNPARGVQLASSIQAEYTDAPLFQDEIQLEHDLIFQYSCVAGWTALFHNLTALIGKQ